MITRLLFSGDSRVIVHDAEESWCDIEITNLVEGVHRPVSVVIRLSGDRYPKRLAQAQFIAADGGGLVTRIIEAPPNRCDWDIVHCQDMRTSYLFMDHQRDLDEEFGAGDHLEIDIGKPLYATLVRQLAAWDGRHGVPAKLRRDPWGRGEHLPLR